MKRLFNVTMVAFCSILLLTNCTNKKVQRIIDESNKGFPIELSEGIMATGIELEGDNVVYNYVVSESIVNLDALSKNKASLKSGLVQNLGSGSSQKLIEMAVENGLGLLYRYKGVDSGRTIEVNFDAKEVKEILETPSTPENRLKSFIDNTNIQLPMKIADGFVFTELYINGDNVIYRYAVDDKIVNLNDMKKNLKASKEAILKEIDNLKEADYLIMQTIAENNKNVIYQYVSTKNQKTVDILITHSELIEHIH